MKMHPQAKTARGHITTADGGGHPQSKTGSAGVAKSVGNGKQDNHNEMQHADMLCRGKMMKSAGGKMGY